jgi:hypothetical protein
MPEQTIARTEILLRVKDLLADIGGLDPAEIKSDLDLGKDPLNYTGVAKQALAGKLLAVFSEYPINVSPMETSSCEVVRDLRELLERKLKEAGVAVAGGSIFGQLQ